MGVTTVQRRQSRRLRQVAVGTAVCLVFYYLFFVVGRSHHDPHASEGIAASTSSTSASTKSAPLLRQQRQRPAKHHSPALLGSLFLTEKQCTDAFPGLMQSIDDVVAEGPFRVKDGGDLGPLQGRIRDGKASCPLHYNDQKRAS